MSTLFLKIPFKAPFDYTGFKARYLELTGEKIQTTPVVNEQETHYLVGTPDNGPRQMLTQEMADQLMGEYPLVSVANIIPVGWTSKTIEI